MATLIDLMRPKIDETINSLAHTKSRTDPIGGKEYSLGTSIVSAAYKRHGRILEHALRLRLAACEYFAVWHEPQFLITRVADQAISGRNAEIGDSLPIELPYLGEGRPVEVDLIVFDKRTSLIRAYEVKRANGHFDAGKKRSILKDLLSVQALLRSYASKRGINVNIAEARVIAYYGLKPLPAPLCILGAELDDHFVFPVQKQVEEVNDYFRQRLHQLLFERAGLEKRQSYLPLLCSEETKPPQGQLALAS